MNFVGPSFGLTPFLSLPQFLINPLKVPLPEHQCPIVRSRASCLREDLHCFIPRQHCPQSHIGYRWVFVRGRGQQRPLKVCAKCDSESAILLTMCLPESELVHIRLTPGSDCPDKDAQALSCSQSLLTTGIISDFFWQQISRHPALYSTWSFLPKRLRGYSLVFF